MQSVTLFVLVCLIGAVLSRPEAEVREVGANQSPTYLADSLHRPVEQTRTKRSLLLLKKKLLLGALGLKAAKVGAVGVAGALALKSKGHKSVPTKIIVDGGHHGHHGHGGYGYSSHAPNWNVEVHSWSG